MPIVISRPFKLLLITGEYYQVVRSYAPVAYWRLGEKTGTQAIDEIFDNTGTYVNTPTLGRPSLLSGDNSNTSVAFEATTSERVSVSNDSKLIMNAKSWTVECWAKPNGSNQNTPLITKRQATVDFEQYSLFIANDVYSTTNGQKLGFLLREGASSERGVIGTTNDVLTGSAVLLCGTYDQTADDIQIYIDGDVAPSTLAANSGTAPITINNTDPLFMAHNNALTNYTGDMDEVAIYARAITPTESKRRFLVGTGSSDNYETLSKAQGPVAYWRLGESSGTTATDTMGSYDGTYNNTPTLGVTGPIANDLDTAVTFSDTSSEYISTSYAGILGSNDRTVSFWIKTTDSSSTNGIVSWGDEGSSGGKWNVRINSSGANGTIGAIRTEVTSGYQTATLDIADDEWHHVVSVFTGSNVTDVKHYVDGNLEASSGSSSQAINTLSSANVHVARKTTGGSPEFEYFDGSLDEVKIFDRALSTEEINEEYAMGKYGPNTYGFINHKLDPFTYWRFGEAGSPEPSIATNEASDKQNISLFGSITAGEPGGITNDNNTCYAFSGGYLKSSSSTFRITGDITFSCWVNADSWDAEDYLGACRLPGDAASANTLWSVIIAGSGTIIRFFHEYNTGVDQLINIAHAISSGSWHHIVMTRDTVAKVYRAYVDGVDVGNSGYTTNPNNGGSAVLTIASADDTPNGTFNGKMDEVSIFKKVLSPEQIKMLYDKGTGVF